jgi:hypothetical protein
MTSGLDRQVRLALRAARTFSTELGNSAALAKGADRDTLVESAQHLSASIEGLKGLIRRLDSQALVQLRQSEMAADGVVTT